MKKLAIIGAGDLGQQIAYHASNDGHYEVVGFYDDFKDLGEEVIGRTNNIVNDFESNLFDFIMIGIGYKHMIQRNNFFDKFKGKIPFGSIIHSSCSIDSSCNIGEGTFLYPNCTLGMNVVLEENILLNIGCTIAHDSKVGQSTFLGPNVTLAGFVNISSCVNLGVSTTVIDNINVASFIKTGAATTVVKNLEEPGLYIGTPATKIKELKW